MKDTYIKIRIGGEAKKRWQEKAKGAGMSLTELIFSTIDNVPTKGGEVVSVPTNVPTKTKQVFQSVEIGPLESREDIRRRVIEEISGALELGERENWERVKKLVRESGYEWSITTRELREGGILIKKFPL